MKANKRVAVIGHSFVRRLNDHLQLMDSTRLRLGFNLQQCDVSCVGYGGWHVMDKQTLRRVFHTFLCTFKPNILVIQTEANDLSNLSAHPLLTADAMEELTAALLSEYNVEYVVICEIFTRKTSGIPAELYESRWRQVMNYLPTLVESNRNIRIRKHCRIFGTQEPIFNRGGAHLNNLGQHRFYRSLRLAIMTAVRECPNLYSNEEIKRYKYMYHVYTYTYIYTTYI